MPGNATSGGNQKEDELESPSLREERALAFLPPELMQNIVEALASPGNLDDALSALFQTLHAEWGVPGLSLQCDEQARIPIRNYGEPTSSFDQEANCTPTACERICLRPTNLPIHNLAILLPQNALRFERQKERIFAIISPILTRRLEQEGFRQHGERAEERSRQRLGEVAAIYDIGQALDQIDHPRLFELITHRAARIMDAQTCSLMVFNGETQRLKVVASYGLPEDATQHEPQIGEGIAGIVALTEQPLLITANIENPLLSGIPLSPDIRSSMLVPMKSQEGSILGVLSIRRNKPAPDFKEADLKVFSVFATQAALALSNKHLYDDLRKRAVELQKLETLSRALISTLNLEDLLSRVADDVRQVVGFERCCLLLRETNRQVFTPIAWRGYPLTVLRNPVRQGVGAVGLAARDKKLTHFDSRIEAPIDEEALRIYNSCNGFARSLGSLSFVIVPILDSKNRCLGVVVADNRSSQESIPPEQISLLSAFVNQAGIALENARLYDDTQENLQKIHRLNNETDNVLQSIGSCILSADARGYIFRWNRATIETLKLPPTAFKGVSLRELIRRIELPADEQKFFLEMFSRVVSTGESATKYKWTLHPANRPPMTLDLRMSRLLDHNQQQAGIVLTFEDVTKEVRLEAEVERMRRLADIGQLAARMAHEVRNALSPIRGAAQMMRLEGEGNQGIGEWADIIVAEVDGLALLTSEMLDFARPTSLDLRIIDVAEFLQSAIQSSSSILMENSALIDLELDEELPAISGDPHLLRQAVRNMLANASQSMPEGGLVTVQATSHAASNSIVIRFRDTGIGIPKKDLERIFRPFVTNRVKGTGLGLPIVLKIVVQHGGRVEVESEVGKGTCFSVWLPIEPPHDQSRSLLEELPVVGSVPGAFPDPYS